MAGLINTHSGYSFLMGAARLEELVARAAALGWRRMALTDLNNMHGSVWFWQFAEEAGVRPVLGAEIDDERGERAVLIAKDLSGYGRLCRTLSGRHLSEGFSLCHALGRPLPGIAVLTNQPELALYLAGVKEGPDLYFMVLPNAIHRGARFCQRHGIRPVAANPVYYLGREDRDLHRMLRAIDLKQPLSAKLEKELVPDPAWLPSPDEFAHWYRDLPEAVRELAMLFDRCELDRPPWGEVVLYDFDGMGSDGSFRLLCAKVREGATKRYGRITPEVRSRIRKELALIRDRGFASYFLIIEDIVKRFPLTCGRGSAAASVVSYCLFITHVDPVRHNLLFERFLSKGRKDPPDIDVDFPWDERDGVLDYVFERYGESRTAMVCNHLTFRAKGAVREIARAMGLPEPETSRVTKRMRGFRWKLTGTDEMGKDPRMKGVHLGPPWDRIVENALRLDGLPYGLSVHCGGVVIADRLRERVPVQIAPKGVRVIHWEKDQTEDGGLIKLDLLGNRSLAVIRDGLGDVAASSGGRMPYAELDPLDDPGTQKLIESGKTMGVFYIESPATRQLQQKAGAGDFEHVVIHSSIIRPAAHRLINEYVRRLHGESWESIHPRLDEILSETFGIMVYQEDVMKVAHHLAGFPIEDADELRRVLSKKHKKKRLREFERMFFSGCAGRGIPEERAAMAWQMILSFSGYSFCKPHSASYALVSFKSAWLKAHHPAEFMAAVISNQGGYYSVSAYLSETRRLGLSVLLPDINRSEVRYIAEGDAVRVGLMQVKGLQDSLAESILEERKRAGEYEGLSDFLHRVRPDPEQARLLIKARCFDALEGEPRRPALLWTVNAWEKSGESDMPGLFRTEIKVPAGLSPLPEEGLLEQEREALGCLVSRHPLDLYADALSGLPLTKARDFRRHVDRRVMAAGVCVTGKLVETKDGHTMEFVSFEDDTDIYETVFFPAAYRRFCHLVHKQGAYLLSGRVSNDMGALSLVVDSVRALRQMPGTASAKAV